MSQLWLLQQGAPFLRACRVKPPPLSLQLLNEALTLEKPWALRGGRDGEKGTEIPPLFLPVPWCPIGPLRHWALEEGHSLVIRPCHVLSDWVHSSVLDNVPSLFIFVCFETGFLYVAQAGLHLLILLTLSPRSWDYNYKHRPLGMASFCLFSIHKQGLSWKP